MGYTTQESLCQRAAEAFSAEDLAAYIARMRGENARPLKGGAEWMVGNKSGSNSTHVRMRDGKAVATDFAGDGREKDAIDWIQELEGIRDVGEAARRAMEIAGVRMDAPQPRTPAPAPAPQPLPAALLSVLRRGIDTAEFVAWCTLRGISIDTVRQIPWLGYHPSASAAVQIDALRIHPRSLVFWGADGWAKAVPLGDDGYRDKSATRHATIRGSGQWQPIMPSPSAPTILVEGETAALALLSCGVQAIPCKVGADSAQRIRDMMARGCDLYFGYDLDNGGAKLLDSARAKFPQIPDISALWAIGKRRDGTPDPDPNGYIIAIGDRDTARAAIETEIRRASDDMAARLQAERPQPAAQEKPEKKKKPKPRDVCNAFFEAWKYDDFYDECIAPDGKRYTEDQAESLAYKATEADVTSIRNAIKNAVKYAMGNQINGLYEHTMHMAESCTDADNGAIDRFCARMQFDPYEARRVRLWLYQVVARAVLPGEKTDGMLVVVSHDGGKEKTKLFNSVSRAMTQGRKAAQPFTFKGNKDEMISLATNCVVIIDEIDKLFKKKDVSELKATITLEGADIRDAYARSARPRKFCAVFGATSNDLNPIPAGEGDARRYWVVQPSVKMDITTPECESMMREAARDVIAELDAHAHEYDKNTVVGKLWVETEAEYKETVARNNSRKSSNSASIALENAARYVAAQPDAPWKDAPCSAASIAACVETGSLDPMRIPSAQGTWPHTVCNSADVGRIITARIAKRTTARIFGVGKRTGYTWRAIIEEFLHDETAEDSDGSELHFADAPENPYGGYYNGY